MKTNDAAATPSPCSSRRLSARGVRHTVRGFFSSATTTSVSRPSSFAGEGGDAALPDAVVLFDERFDVLRIVIEAANDEHVLEAAADIELVIEHEAEVAAAQPAGAPSASPGSRASKTRRAQLRPAPVAAALAAAANPDLADLALARLAWSVRHVDDPDLRRAQRPAAADERRGVGRGGIRARRLDHVLAKRRAIEGLRWSCHSSRPPACIRPGHRPRRSSSG